MHKGNHNTQTLHNFQKKIVFLLIQNEFKIWSGLCCSFFSRYSLILICIARPLSFAVCSKYSVRISLLLQISLDSIIGYILFKIATPHSVRNEWKGRMYSTQIKNFSFW